MLRQTGADAEGLWRIHVLWTARFIPCFRLQWVNDILAAHQVNEAAAEVIGQILVLHLRIERTHPHIGFPQVCQQEL